MASEHARSSGVEIKVGDLFTSTLPLAHCVSEDFAMGAGIALEFRTRFGLVDELKAQKRQVGDVAYIQHDGHGYLFYLVTKSRYWEKPTYSVLQECLEQLHALCTEFGVKAIAMPRIGCGLDRLQWNVVQQLIESTMKGIDVQVYTL